MPSCVVFLTGTVPSGCSFPLHRSATKAPSADTAPSEKQSEPPVMFSGFVGASTPPEIRVTAAFPESRSATFTDHAW